MKKQILPDNVFELLFGVGAGVVIIGALLKIINGSLIFSANSWLIAGLSVEAGIFVLSGIQGFLLGKEDKDNDVVSTIALETAALQKAVDGTVKGLNSLNSNLSSATKATGSISVPSDLSSNAQALSEGLSNTSLNINELNKLYDELGKTLSKVNSATDALDIPEGVGAELQKMKNTIKELNSRYEAMLSAMNK